MTTIDTERVVTTPTETQSLTTGRRSDGPSPQQLRAAVDETIRDIIQRDPELWTRVQADPALWQTFGFADQPPVGTTSRREVVAGDPSPGCS